MGDIQGKHQKNSRLKIVLVFVSSLILGYLLFILPDLFFGISKINGGKKGINLLFIALFQFFGILGLLSLSLKILGKSFKSIGLDARKLNKDILLGLGFGLAWTLLQFLLIIPLTGGANREDIQALVKMYDGSLVGLLSFIALGAIGGGITEELFNRGFFISVLKDAFKDPKTGLWISASLSVLIFALGHMPASALDWLDILIPTTIYTLLYIKTQRLTASILAHASYNSLAIILTYYIYAV
tara:strand:- start:230 stop:955 length:726 start_codon:yes stop_codon:yes gene_type:complete